MKQRSKLIEIALAFCPRAFRQEYAEHIYAHAEEGGNAVSIALDAFAAGFAARCETLANDISFSCRSLLNAPAVTTICVVAMAFAIGSNVAIGSVVNGVLLRPLSYPDAASLVFISLDKSTQTFPSFLDARDIASGNVSFSDVGSAKPDNLTLLDQGRHLTLRGQMIDGQYMRTLRARAELGRLINSADDGKALIVISDGLWRRSLGGSLDIIGKSLLFDRRSYIVVGVMESAFRDPIPGALRRSSYWVPVDRASLAPDQRGMLGDTTVARLRPNIGAAAAQTDVTKIVEDLASRYPANFNAGSRPGVISIQEAVSAPVRPLILTLFFVITLVLLIACANVANLLLLRASARNTELAVRLALGASASRIISQLFVESALLSGCGGLLGLGLASVMLRVFSVAGPRFIPRWEDVRIDGPITAYALFVTLVVAVVTGTFPGIFERSQLAQRMRSRGGESGNRRSSRMRAALVSIEVALAISVTLSAGLVLRSFIALTHVELGFVASNLYDVNFGLLPENRYPTAESRTTFVTRARKVILAIPGVVDASVTGALPFSDTNTVGFTIVGMPAPHTTASLYATDPSYLETLRIPLLRGRRFNAEDRTLSAPVALVSTTFALKYFGTIDAVGKRIIPSESSSENNVLPIRKIVGVVGDIRQSLSSPPQASIYAPSTQLLAYWRFVVRSDKQAGNIGSEIAAAIGRVDSRLPTPEVRTMQSYQTEDALRSQATALLLGLLALVASVLALAGVYTTASYMVRQRRQEFGICMAIGARSMHLVLATVSRNSGAVFVGVGVGIVFSAAFSNLLQKILFEIAVTDVLTIAATTIFIVLAATVASFVPAMQITRISPSKALRYE